MKKFGMLFSTVILIFLSYAPALACACDLPIKPIPLRVAVSEAKAKADVVFSGEVVELNEFTVKFRVESIWKGAPAEEIVMRTGTAKAENGDLIFSTCDYRFVLGEKYLVYASGSGRRLQTHKCSRTKVLESAREDVEALDKLKEERKPLCIEGKS